MVSNIYLNEALDKWFAMEIRPLVRGRAIIVRFTDDAVLGFENKEDAERVFKVLLKRFDKFRLQLHPDKTKRINFSKPPRGNDKDLGKRITLNFLGFTFFWSKSRKGNWVVRMTAEGRLKKIVGRINV